MKIIDFVLQNGGSGGGGGGGGSDNLPGTMLKTVTELNYPDLVVSIPSSYFMSCYDLSLASFPKATEIGQSAFYRCSSLAEINFANVSSINTSAFRYCYELKGASLPECTYIASWAFTDCSKLEYLYAPKLVSTGQTAFRYCSTLSSIYCPEVTTLGNEAFANCSSLSSIRFEKLQSFWQMTFYSSPIEYARFDAITSFPAQGMYYYGNIKTVVLDNVSNFGGSAFYNATKLSNLYLLGSAVCTTEGYIFGGTPIADAGATASIFVRASLYDAYVANSFWRNYSAKIVSISDEEIAALG